MPGRAIILVVAGVVIITGIILHRIEAASTNIAANFNNYFLQQTARNIAQSGVNLALRQLGYNRTWRAGFPQMSMLGGKVYVDVYDTMFAGIPAIGIRSTGIVEHRSSIEKQATSTAFAYFPNGFIPLSVKGLLTLNGSNQVNGNITLDGRDHDEFAPPNQFNPGKGTYGVWTTGASFVEGSAAAKIGGTADSIDYIPTNPCNPVVVKKNQSFPNGYPNTPDSAFGGPSYGYPEGTLKAIAQSGVAGSQYVTDPTRLTYPLRGVTYVEIPTSSPKNRWSSATINGTGILIIHNSVKNAVLENAAGNFSGIVVVDDIVRFHGNLWGAIIGLTNTPSGNVLGNGNAYLSFSRKAISNATGFLANDTQLKVIAWWE
ncbi:MAG: hypothetical protein QME52_01975 [Bacteroidota bacterium]|nr:hypothetical protein [Bacteroidota bacterium]